MDAAVGAANWILGKVLSKLSDDLVAGYVASRDLGLNFDKIKTDLKDTLGLLYEAQGRKVHDYPLLKGPLEDLTKKADEAENALDELEYFIIQDELDGTHEATPEVGRGLCSHARHGCQAFRHTVGNWLSWFPCCLPLPQDDVDKLSFDRVAMSSKIKELMMDIDSMRPRVSDILHEIIKNSPLGSMAHSLERTPTGSTIIQDRLYGRSIIFKETIDQMTNATCHETLSVLPIVGPGGIGKTTFARHLYNDKWTVEHFTIRIWVCVTNNYTVLKLTKEILSCILAETGSSNQADQSNNLDQLQKSIINILKSKRFLIVLDDTWKIKSDSEWEELISPFTNKGADKGSMILITTRLPITAEMTAKAISPVDLQGLEPSEFWEFFKACVFGEAIAEQVLIETARKIANELKCSPLAAKTVGRLLNKDLKRSPLSALEHWKQILESKEWLKQKEGDGIMPALKISYDYLPFYLKNCFLYCSLFPQNHWFDNLKISNFWSAIGILDSSGRSGKIEDISSKYLGELVDNGFLMRGYGDYYVMHDLFHELAQTISSHDCLNISCSSFMTDAIPPTIRHLSITMGGGYSNDFKQQMHKLKGMIDIANLRTLMIFGRYDTNIDSVLKDVFEEMKRLRVLVTFMNSQESLPNNFGKLIHLRYLKIGSPFCRPMYLPSTLDRFYHLELMDLKSWGGSNDLPKNICRLKNLRHFLAGREFHSNVPEASKMKHLQELKEFHVKKENVGFEMKQLGYLTELGGELSICNLENVRTKEEANEAKLKEKNNLRKLRLVWSGGQPSGGVDDVLDGLQPHSSLRSLHIVNHSGAIGSRWLCDDFCIQNLESLNLKGISWATLPPFQMIPCLRELELKNIAGLRQFRLDLFGGFMHKSSLPLKRIVFEDMPELVEWVGGASSFLFSALESIRCDNCPNLSTLSILSYLGPSSQDMIGTPNLRSLTIYKCPKLSLPPMPHTSTLTEVYVDQELTYEKTELKISGYVGDLAFYNLGNLEDLIIENVPQAHMPLTGLQKLNSLRSLEICDMEDAFFRGLDDGGVVFNSVQILKLLIFPLTSKSLSNVFKCFPAVSDLEMSPSNRDHDEEVVLQLPSSSSIQRLAFRGCKNLILPTEGGGVLRELMKLQSLTIEYCGRMLSLWSMGEAAEVINPFPASLRELCIFSEPGLQAMGMLSNLTSLTCLELRLCVNLTMDGFDPLITFNLKRLVLVKAGLDRSPSGSVAAALLSEVARRTNAMPGGSFQLQHLDVDRILATLVAPLCSHFSTTLQELIFTDDVYAKRFTEEQEQVLQRLTSLKELQFAWCTNLQSLPATLHRLSSLKGLHISGCSNITSLPKEGLPTSLKLLWLLQASPELVDECKKLEETRPNLYVNL